MEGFHERERLELGWAGWVGLVSLFSSSLIYNGGISIVVNFRVQDRIYCGSNGIMLGYGTLVLGAGNWKFLYYSFLLSSVMFRTYEVSVSSICNLYY